MKLRKKQKIAILERAYDKAARLVSGGVLKLAPLEQEVLADCLSYSNRLSHEKRRSYRNNVWEHFGWNTTEAQAKYEQTLKNITEGITTVSESVL